LLDDNEGLRFDLTEFLNLYPLRTPRIMWFLGAGTSVSAGLPTAMTLTWEFKRAIYCNDLGVPLTRFSDLNDKNFQSLIQSYFDSRTGNPRLWDNSEYSHYFQKYLPDERDRRTFLNDRLRGTKPAYGHYCLAGLIALRKIQIVWTTNFDRLVERAHSEVQALCETPDELAVASVVSLKYGNLCWCLLV
jgi:NAD-dependent SIR2 family protein deacetylase